MFKINGITVAEPAYGGVQITDEPIWASNTGRGSDGKMIGDIVAWKTTVAVTWPPLTFTQSQAIRNAIVNAGPFFNIVYNDFSASSTVTKKVYCGNIPRVLASISSAFQKHTDMTISFIEQ